MRAPLLLLTSLLPACIFDLSDDDDDDLDPDTWFPSETGVPSALPLCGDVSVQPLVRDLPRGVTQGCGHAWFAAAVTSGDREAVLDVFVDTPRHRVGVPGAPTPDGSVATGPNVDGVFVVDLAKASAMEGLARLAVGRGLFASRCTDVAVESDTEAVWVGVAGLLHVEVTGVAYDDLPQGDAPFEGTVSVRDLVLQDADGGACRVPDATWQGVLLGWSPG